MRPLTLRGLGGTEGTEVAMTFCIYDTHIISLCCLKYRHSLDTLPAHFSCIDFDETWPSSRYCSYWFCYICAQRARDQLQGLFPSSGNFTPTTLFIATWDRVAQFGGGPQVSTRYTIICLLVSTTTHRINTASRPRGTDIMGHYHSNSAMEDDFISLSMCHNCQLRHIKTLRHEAPI